MLLEGEKHNSRWLNSFNCCFKQRDRGGIRGSVWQTVPAVPLSYTIPEQNSAGKLPGIHFNIRDLGHITSSWSRRGHRRLRPRYATMYSRNGFKWDPISSFFTVILLPSRLKSRFKRMMDNKLLFLEKRTNCRAHYFVVAGWKPHSHTPFVLGNSYHADICSSVHFSDQFGFN